MATPYRLSVTEQAMLNRALRNSTIPVPHPAEIKVATLLTALRDIRDKIEEQIDGDSRGDTMYSEWVRDLDAVIAGATR